MRIRSRRIRVAALLCALASTPLARADDGDETAIVLRRAFELRREHRNEEALAQYEQAFALSPTPAVRAQLALAEQALGHWLTAERDLDLALATDDPWVERNRHSLEDAVAVVRQHLAWVAVEVDTPGADIQLDGAPISGGREARVVAGVGVLEVRAPGCVPDIRRVSFAPSEHVHQRISLVPFLAALPPPPVATPLPSAVSGPSDQEPALTPPYPVIPAVTRDSHSAIPFVPIALGALGIAGIATGAYFGVRTGDERKDELAQCGARGCAPAAANDYSTAQTFAAASTIAFTAGIALVAGGGVVWVLGRTARRPATGTLELAPVVGARMDGFVLSGSL